MSVADAHFEPTALARVPRWGRVAFAARCARRVQEFFYLSCIDAGTEFQQVIRAAIEHAERLASQPPNPPSPAALSADVEIGLFRAVYRASDESFLAVERAFRIALHAHRAASCAVFDSIPHNPDNDSDLGEVVAAGRIASGLACKPYVVNDFDHLANVIVSKRWTDSTAVPKDFFGLMWPTMDRLDPNAIGDAASMR